MKIRGNSASYRTARLARDAPEVVERMKAGKDPKTIAEKAKPLAEHGGDRKSEEGKSTLRRNVEQQGNSKEYRAARLARDAPDVVERMKRRFSKWKIFHFERREKTRDLAATFGENPQVRDSAKVAGS